MDCKVCGLPTEGGYCACMFIDGEPRSYRDDDGGESLRSLYLKSCHPYNFRNGKELPRIIGFVLFKPSELKSRPCFKVIYESDHTIDYVAYSEVVIGNWEIVH